MRHCSVSAFAHLVVCAVSVVAAPAVASGQTGSQAWREVAPPHEFSFVRQPSSYLSNGLLASWNLAAQFNSGGANPSGQWAVGYAANRFGAFTVSPDWGATLPGAFGWFTSSVGLLPTGVKVQSATLFPTLGTGVSLPAGAVGVMPDNLGRFAAVRWTCPEPGQYAIDAQFTGRSTLETGNSDIAVLRNGMQLFFSTVRDPRQILIMQTTFDLVPGETMDFRVGKSNDSNLNDLKQLDVVIQRLPRLCPGDINGDGVVNVVDLTALVGGFGTQVIPSEGGDINGDGVVDINDLSLLLGNLGCTV